MTHQSDIAHRAHRRAIAVLLAAAALPSNALAQETVTPPTVPAPSQQTPAPAPGSAPAQTGESPTRIAPGVLEHAEQEARERAAERRAQRTEARPRRTVRSAPTAERAAAPPPARTEAPAPAPQPAPEPAAPTAAEPVTPVDTAPETAAPAETVPPIAEAPATPAETAPEPVNGGSSLWLILAALGLAAAAIAAFLLLRPRRDRTLDERELVEPAPIAAAPEPREKPAAAVRKKTPRSVAEPVAAAPVFVARPVPEAISPQTPSADAPVKTEAEPHAALENAAIVTPADEDVNAVLGGASGEGNRPQLELAMRPTSAGVSRHGARVQFELTVANAGGVPAEDVRIGAFMLGATPEQDSEIEKLLIDPPADLVVPVERIEPGRGTRLDAAITLPRGDVDAAAEAGEDGFTPVLVADARYRLPDGREGRTAAAFTIGRVNGGEALVPLALQDDPATYADIEARLHSVPAKV